MALAKKCDLCGELYEIYGTADNEEKPNGIMLVNIEDTPTMKYHAHAAKELCPDCMNKVMDLLDELS